MDSVIDETERRYRELENRLLAPPRCMQFHRTPQHDGGAHIEYTGSTLHYVNTERGNENRRRSTDDPEELFRWLVEDLTWDIASGWESRHRNENEDCRIQLFEKQVELLDSINPEWAIALRAKYDQLLARDRPET